MEWIDAFLEERVNSKSLRQLSPAAFFRDGRINMGGREYLNFSSNDYLSLAGHPEITEAAREAAEKFGNSSSASRLMSGDLALFHRLEEQVAVFKRKESALVFNSGYQANVGIISSVLTRNDVVFSDKLSHASILDGIMLSGARSFRFRHNDAGHLEALLRKERAGSKKALIITETIFSMDGDRAPLKQLAGLKERYGCMLMVDEAHATGIFGKNGGGVAEEDSLAERIDLIMGTFGKALGSFGAYVACSEKMSRYLVNACRAFIYSTALPPSVIAADMAAIKLVGKEPHRRKTLLDNADYFRKRLAEKGFGSSSSSQIVPVIVGENEAALAAGRKLFEKGFLAVAVRPPTVPEKQARLRFSLTFSHSRESLDKLVDAICETVKI